MKVSDIDKIKGYEVTLVYPQGYKRHTKRIWEAVKCTDEGVIDSFYILELTKGYATIIDISDLEKVCEHNWRVDVMRPKSPTPYISVSTEAAKDPNFPCTRTNRTHMRLHQLLTGFGRNTNNGLTGYHRDLNPLNNRQSNLTLAKTQ